MRDRGCRSAPNLFVMGVEIDQILGDALGEVGRIDCRFQGVWLPKVDPGDALVIRDFLGQILDSAKNGFWLAEILSLQGGQPPCAKRQSLPRHVNPRLVWRKVGRCVAG